MNDEIFEDIIEYMKMYIPEYNEQAISGFCEICNKSYSQGGLDMVELIKEKSGYGYNENI